MRCAWNEFLKLLPQWIRFDVDKQGKDRLLELRLRRGECPELVTQDGSVWLSNKVTLEDIAYCVNVASKYSPWAASTISQGYITSPGGHRVGICGQATIIENNIRGIVHPTSLCLRVAREYTGIAEGLLGIQGSILILGKPGYGKTTLLRDLIRLQSESRTGSVCVVDEKGELFPYSNNSPCFEAGRRTDIITGCDKARGIDIVLRNMCPRIIAVDEITAEGDCTALIRAGWCGVSLYATAHASNIREFQSRPIYKMLLDSNLFHNIIVMHHDKTWRVERMEI